MKIPSPHRHHQQHREERGKQNEMDEEVKVAGEEEPAAAVTRRSLPKLTKSYKILKT